MKNYKKLIAVLLVAVLALSLAACGKGGGESKPSPVGTYTLSGMTQDGEETSQEDLDMMASLGYTISLEFKEDNTGTMSLFGEESEFTWDDSSLTIEDESIPYTFDGTTIVLEEEGMSMTFTKDAES